MTHRLESEEETIAVARALVNWFLSQDLDGIEAMLVCGSLITTQFRKLPLDARRAMFEAWVEAIRGDVMGRQT